MAAKDNLTWLRAQGYRYLVVSRERERQFDPQRPWKSPPPGATRCNCNWCRMNPVRKSACMVIRWPGQKENAITRRFAERFETGVQKMAAGLAQPRGEKRLAELHERLGRLKEKTAASQHYTIELVPDAEGKQATALHFDPQPIDGSRLTHPGVYCLRSNAAGWDAEQMSRTDTLLTDLEAVFRSLKSELGRRPVFHHKEQRVDGHLFITVLAYQCVQLIRRRYGNTGWRTVDTLRDTLASQGRVTATFQRADGRTCTSAKPRAPNRTPAPSTKPSTLTRPREGSLS